MRFRCTWSLQEHRADCKSMTIDRRYTASFTRPPPTLVKHILWQGFVGNETTPNELLRDVLMN
jgi:hypothetical protein